MAEAVASMEFLASSSSTGFGSFKEKARCDAYLCGSSFNSIFNNFVSQIVCDALVAYYGPDSILQAIFKTGRTFPGSYYRTHYATHSPSFLIILAACYSGDVNFLQQALDDAGIFKKTSNYYSLISSCLSVACQQGHLCVTQFLLDDGFDINHIGLHHTSAILAAAKNGNHDLLELLLRPQYGLNCWGDPENLSNNSYKFALIAAPEHHDDSTRFENVKTLYLAADKLTQSRNRETLFFRACYSADMALAKWLLDDRPVDMYIDLRFLMRKNCYFMLQWLAQEGKIEWVQWFLRVQPPRVSEKGQHRHVLEAALRSAIRGKHLQTFFEIARYFVHDASMPLIKAASIEDGLPRLLACWPSLDLQTTLSQKVEVRRRELTVGNVALHTAIEHGRSSNVQMLLERGARSARIVYVDRSYYDEHRPSFSAIETMLLHYKDPMFRLHQEPNIYEL